jgi:hypothetical protein
MARKSTQIVQLKLRIPEYIRKLVAERAKKSGRSLNGELAFMLGEATAKQSFDEVIKAATADAASAATLQTLKALWEAKVTTLSEDEMKQIVQYSARPVKLFEEDEK